MKKKLFFCISIILCIVLFMSTIPFSAYIVEPPIDVTSRAVLVANLETDTFVYEKNSTGIRYISNLTNIMTFIIARNAVIDINEKVKIEKEVLDKVENPDNTLDKYTGKTLTVCDLLHYIMLTDGRDASYVLADFVCDGDIEEFVGLMNKKAKSIGCENTVFKKPYNFMDKSQYTTCVDMYKIVKCALDTPDYSQIASKASYVPEGYDEKEDVIVTNNSLLRSQSPYYFKHVKNGKFSKDRVSRGNLVAVSYYNKVRYACIIFGADLQSEHNAYTEAKQLLSWSYLYLANSQIFSKNQVLSTVTVPAPWGETAVNLTTGVDIVRTMPADYERDLITYKMNDDIKVELPVFEGQNMGSAKVYYDGEFFEEVNIVSDDSHGTNMLSDISNFLGAMLKDTVNDTEPTETATEPETQPQTEKPTKSKTPAETQQSTQAGQ